jgi:fumarate hydratase class II
MPNIRKERDSLGVVELPADKLWADQPLRSLEVKHCHSWRDGPGSAPGWL